MSEDEPSPRKKPRRRRGDGRPTIADVAAPARVRPKTLKPPQPNPDQV
jgi:hypothetical protein